MLPPPLLFQFGLPALLACMAVMAASPAKADISGNPCTSDWTGPSSDNKFECNGVVSWVIEKAIPIAVPFVLAVLITFPGCCLVLGSRYCCSCCGSSQMRPGHVCCGGSELDALPTHDKVLLYDKCGIRSVKLLTVFLAVVGATIVAISFIGGSKIASSARETTTGFTDGVEFALDLINRTLDAIKDPVSGAYPSGFSSADFDDATRRLTDIKNDAVGYVNTYSGDVTTYSLVPAFVSILPALVMAVPVLFALCSIQAIGPLAVICCSFSLQFVFMTVATVLAVVLLPLDIVCNELTDQLDGKPGVFQWYVVPSCESNTPFQSVRDNIDTMEYDASTDACSALLDICSTSTIYNPSYSKVVFICNVTSSGQCPNLETVQGTMGAMSIKSGAPETCGGNPSQCTVQYCADHCDDSTARSSAKEAVANLNTAVRVKDAFISILLPWFDCNRIINKVISSGPEQLCSGIVGGIRMVCVGSYMSSAGLIVCIVVCLLGQKRFVDQEHARKMAYTRRGEEGGDGYQMAMMPPTASSVDMAPMPMMGGAPYPPPYYTYTAAAPALGVPMLSHQQDCAEYQPPPPPKKESSFETDHVPPPMMAASPDPTNQSLLDAAGVTMLGHGQHSMNNQPAPKQEDSFVTDSESL